MTARSVSPLCTRCDSRPAPGSDLCWYHDGSQLCRHGRQPKAVCDFTNDCEQQPLTENDLARFYAGAQ